MARSVQARRMGTSKRRASVKSRKPRSVVRRSNFNVRGMNPSRSLTVKGYGFPDSLKTNLAYSESFILSPTAVNPTQAKGWRLTSLYDPELSVGGGQPYWFDQLAAVYSRYRVLGAKITATFAYESIGATAGVGPTICGIQCAEASSLSSVDAGVLMTTSNTCTDMLSVQSDKVVCVATYSPKQAYGDVLVDALTAATTSDPSRNWNAFTFISPQGTNMVQTVNVTVLIEYFAEFTQQIQNAGS